MSLTIESELDSKQNRIQTQVTPSLCRSTGMLAEVKNLPALRDQKSFALVVVHRVLPRPASYIRRASAYLLDLLAIGTCQFLVNLLCLSLYKLITGHSGATFLNTRAYESYADISSLLCFLAYFTLCYWYTNGLSFGKKICQVRVISDTAQEMSFLRSFLRSISYPLSYLALSLGFILPLLRKDGRALHDLTSRTRVISNF